MPPSPSAPMTLLGVEGEGRQLAEGAGRPLAVGGAVGMGGILEDGDARGRGADRVDVDAGAVEVHRDDRLRAGGEGRGQARRVEVGGDGVDVDEDRGSAGVGDREDRGHVRVGDGDDLVAGADPEGAQGQGQGRGARAAADAGGRPAVGRELGLEGAQLRTEREARPGQAGLEGLAQLGGDGGVPARHVLDRHRRGRDRRHGWRLCCCHGAVPLPPGRCVRGPDGSDGTGRCAWRRPRRRLRVMSRANLPCAPGGHRTVARRPPGPGHHPRRRGTHRRGGDRSDAGGHAGTASGQGRVPGAAQPAGPGASLHRHPLPRRGRRRRPRRPRRTRAHGRDAAASRGGGGRARHRHGAHPAARGRSSDAGRAAPAPTHPPRRPDPGARSSVCISKDRRLHRSVPAATTRCLRPAGRPGRLPGQRAGGMAEWCAS